MREKVLVFLPAFNEEKVILDVIKEIRKEGFKHILVVDDCSIDNTFKICKKAEVEILRHVINRGAGAATKTGIEFAKQKSFDKMVIMDADGQHNPKDISKLLKVSNEFDVVIGSRLKGDISDMPLQRKIANFVGSLITWFVFGKFVWDSQSGFKVLNRKSIENINLTFDSFEFSSEMIGEISRLNLTCKEVPIKVIYTDHSMQKGHGQSINNGFKMIFKFIFRG